jgi:transposase
MVDHCDDPKRKIVRRLEVISAGAGRRRWSEALKSRIVAESFAPGAMVTEVARRHDVRAQQVHAWRRDAREGRLALSFDDPAFVPILPALAPPAAAPASCAESAVLEIEIAGATLRIRGRFEVDALADLFVAVRRSGC